MTAPMQPRRIRPRPVSQSVPQASPNGQPGMPPPVGGVNPDTRSGAMDQYRGALLRRMQGGPGDGLMPDQQSFMPGAGPGGNMPPPQIGAGQAPMGQETRPPAIDDIIKKLMSTRISRRVLGGGKARRGQ